MYRVYGMSLSGNCYKVKLLLQQLEQPYVWQEVDVMAGATQQPAFKAINPNARVPVLEIAPGEYLPESNAILWYLAEGSALIPQQRYQRGQCLQWMFFEQYSHEPYIAVARFINRFLPQNHARRAELPTLLERGYKALDVMELHLQQHAYMVAESYSIADIALYGYTHVAHEGGFDLEGYDAVNEWLQRIGNQPRFVTME